MKLPTITRTLALFSCCFFSHAGFSQEPAAGQSEMKAPAAAAQRDLRVGDWLDLSFAERLRYETVDHRFKLGEDPSDQQLAQRTRVGIGVKKIIDPLRFQFEFEDSRVHLNDSRSTVNLTMRNEHDILQLYVGLAFNQQAHARHPFEIRVGRQSFDLGNRRLFARNRYRNTTNRWDGVRWSIATPKKWTLDTFFFLPVLLRMKEMDRRLKGAYFWGAYYTALWKSGISSELYYFGLREDPNLVLSLKRRHSTIGGRISRNGGPGAYAFEAESAWQFGKVAQLDHFAHFQHLQLGYTFKLPWQPSITGQYDYASGDRDPYDNKSGNFDTLFGARRWEYGPTGIYNWMYRSNINTPALYFGLKPGRKLELIPSVRWLWLAQARAPWVGTQLRDLEGLSGTYVGSSMELRLRCNLAPTFAPKWATHAFSRGPTRPMSPAARRRRIRTISSSSWS